MNFVELEAHHRRAIQSAHDFAHRGECGVAQAYLDHADRLAEVLAQRQAETLALLEAEL